MISNSGININEDNNRGLLTNKATKNTFYEYVI